MMYILYAVTVLMDYLLRYSILRCRIIFFQKRYARSIDRTFVVTLMKHSRLQWPIELAGSAFESLTLYTILSQPF